MKIFLLSFSDIFNPSLRTALSWYPPNQDILFDNNDQTCVAAGHLISNNIGYLYLVLYWNPTATNAQHMNVAFYFCKSKFFVHLTHETGIQFSVMTGNNQLNDMDGHILNYKMCSSIESYYEGGLTKTKFGCQCDSKCDVVLQFSFLEGISMNSSKICSLKMYD